ncbi:hypothetical protein [Methylobacterium marchantiae]|uniref:Uncharacterized protein n=1 Tax=Methylobacterium marchantiae TaxID=600331 RepID=A0ABW3X3C9_9HYPH|nr:hypothetical protein AIGOOFII_3479 [Methylobacterium marchantiae]
MPKFIKLTGSDGHLICLNTAHVVAVEDYTGEGRETNTCILVTLGLKAVAHYVMEPASTVTAALLDG